MKIQLLVLANSKKAGGRCLAGIDVRTLQWVRPITDHIHCEVAATSTINQKTNNQLRPLDLIEIELIEPRPLNYQQENWLCQPETINAIGSFSIESAYSQLRPEIDSVKWFLSNTDAKIDPNDYKKYKTNAPSLGLIEVAGAKLFHNRYGSRRISFKYGKDAWDLPFTDDYYHGEDSNIGRSLLCLSIGEEWKSNSEPSHKTWHYKLVAGLIALPMIKFESLQPEVPSMDSLLLTCERLFKFIPEVLEERKKPMRFASDGWVYQNCISSKCPTCKNPNLLVFRKHFKKYAKEMHYWGIVCSVCKNAKDSKDFSRDFVTQMDLELEESGPITNKCKVCISNLKNF